MNEVIEKLLDDHKITKDEYYILFEDKSSWFTTNADGNQYWSSKSEEKIVLFNESLKKIIGLQEYNNMYNLSFIHFPPFNVRDFFIDSRIDKDISLKFAKFGGEADFMNAKFNGRADFINAKFSSRADFFDTRFVSKVNFFDTKFVSKAYFMFAEFNGEANFYGATFKKLVDFSYISFNNINFENISYEKATFLHLKGYKENKQVPIAAGNFKNKESARLIKAHFEKQGNIIEANRYFVIEQEKYIEDLENQKKTDDNKTRKLIPLSLNKYISNFGVDWVRGILVLFLWGFISLFLFMALRYSLFTFPHEIFMAGEWQTNIFYISLPILFLTIVAYSINLYFEKLKYYKHKTILQTFKFLHKFTKLDSKKYKAIINSKFLYFMLFIALGLVIFKFYNQEVFNLISKLINPINAFKDDDTFKDYEAFGMFVRIVSATIIYQIIVAFRQNTRRS